MKHRFHMPFSYAKFHKKAGFSMESKRKWIEKSSLTYDKAFENMNS